MPALRKRDYATASDQFHQAYELFPTGDYLASEAWALFSDPARSHKKSKELVEAALEQLPPNSERKRCSMSECWRGWMGRPMKRRRCSRR